MLFVFFPDYYRVKEVIASGENRCAQGSANEPRGGTFPIWSPDKWYGDYSKAVGLS